MERFKASLHNKALWKAEVLWKDLGLHYLIQGLWNAESLVEKNTTYEQ